MGDSATAGDPVNDGYRGPASWGLADEPAAIGVSEPERIVVTTSDQMRHELSEIQTLVYGVKEVLASRGESDPVVPDLFEAARRLGYLHGQVIGDLESHADELRRWRRELADRESQVAKNEAKSAGLLKRERSKLRRLEASSEKLSVEVASKQREREGVQREILEMRQRAMEEAEAERTVLRAERARAEDAIRAASEVLIEGIDAVARRLDDVAIATERGVLLPGTNRRFGRDLRPELHALAQQTRSLAQRTRWNLEVAEP